MTGDRFVEVQGIVDRFYADYERARKHLGASIRYPGKVSGDLRDEHATLIMNRVVFTWFLQTPVNGGSVITPGFMQTLLKECRAATNHAGNRPSGYFHVLCKLWFGYFNDGKERSATDGIFKGIPFLDGGLFTRREGIEIVDGKDTCDFIEIPDEIWNEIFTLLGHYSWTVNEVSARENNFSISPSILGHIYEKSCNQKESGSFYTPDHISNGIARKCIATIATDRVNRRFKTSYASFVDQVLKKKRLSPDELDQVSCLYFDVLLPLTICDDACGSGAFLVAAENVLVELHITCLQWLSSAHPGFAGHPGAPADPGNLYAIKKWIITRNLYGVDIQEGSVEIAKLRLWLSLIPAIHAGRVEPLPDIDCNLVAGNSLFGFVKLPRGTWGTSLLASTGTLTSLMQERASLKADSKAVKVEINRKIHELLDDLYAEKIRCDTGIAITPAQLASLKPLHWGFEFEAIATEGGFDAIIGNPPYVNNKMTSDLEKKLFMAFYGLSDDLYNYFFRRSFALVKDAGMLGFITSNTFMTIETKKSLRELLQARRLIEIRMPDPNLFKGIGVITAIVIAKNEACNDYTFTFTDDRTPLGGAKMYEISINTYKDALEKIFFVPDALNMQLYSKYNAVVKRLMDQWWDKISTSKNIAKNEPELRRYRSSLKAGDVTLLGLVTDGGQGMATANNGRFIGAVKGSAPAERIKATRPEKLWKFMEAMRESGKTVPEVAVAITFKQDAATFLSGKDEGQIRALFDAVKERYGRDIFGSGYVYRIVDPSEIADVRSLSDYEKKHGISSGKTFVPYSKGDKEGNRWYHETPFCIDWSVKNVAWLTSNSGKKGEGMPVVRNSTFYFREGICWGNVLNPNSMLVKAKLKPASVHDVGAMSLFSIIGTVNEKYLVCMLNSYIVFHIIRAFINNTVNLQMNDFRMIPIIIPSEHELRVFETIFDDAISIKKNLANSTINAADGKKQLVKIQERLDPAACRLYGIAPELISKKLTSQLDECTPDEDTSEMDG
nr:Eco57I restriction-modification methylase domain-containing protein [Candidatus Sigynarchaeota archaeon]